MRSRGSRRVTPDTATPANPLDAMSCQQFVEIVTDYLERQLDEARRLWTDEHLAQCDACRALPRADAPDDRGAAQSGRRRARRRAPRTDPRGDAHRAPQRDALTHVSRGPGRLPARLAACSHDKARIWVEGGAAATASSASAARRTCRGAGPTAATAGAAATSCWSATPRGATWRRCAIARHFRAGRGGHGRGKQQHGARGEDREIPVPPGHAGRGSATGRPTT